MICCRTWTLKIQSEHLDMIFRFFGKAKGICKKELAKWENETSDEEERFIHFYSDWSVLKTYWPELSLSKPEVSIKEKVTFKYSGQLGEYFAEEAYRGSQTFQKNWRRNDTWFLASTEILA